MRDCDWSAEASPPITASNLLMLLMLLSSRCTHQTKHPSATRSLSTSAAKFCGGNPRWVPPPLLLAGAVGASKVGCYCIEPMVGFCSNPFQSTMQPGGGSCDVGICRTTATAYGESSPPTASPPHPPSSSASRKHAGSPTRSRDEEDVVVQ